MNIEIWSVGKKTESYLLPALEEYQKRMKHYASLQWKLIVPSKQKEKAKIIAEESDSIMELWDHQNTLVLLDEAGTMWSSVELASNISKWQLHSKKKIIFLIGGAFGVSDEIKAKANYTISLSRMVFPHQLVRLIILEQIYRAYTIICGESYHHI